MYFTVPQISDSKINETREYEFNSPKYGSPMVGENIASNVIRCALLKPPT